MQTLHGVNVDSQFPQGLATDSINLFAAVMMVCHRLDAVVRRQEDSQLPEAWHYNGTPF
jgi:hypothetical protein